MSLNLIIGPMFSGKTTELIRQLNKFSSIGQKCIYINSSLDIRETTNFSSHNPSLKKIGDNIDSVKINNMNNYYKDELDYYKKKVRIAIFELQRNVARQQDGIQKLLKKRNK